MDDVFYIIAAIPMWKVITSTSSWLSDHLIRLFNILYFSLILAAISCHIVQLSRQILIENIKRYVLVSLEF